MDLIAIGVSVVAILMALAIGKRQARLEARIQALVRENNSLTVQSRPQVTEVSSLQGLTIGVCIRQDHTIPSFVNLLREDLAREEAHLVVLTQLDVERALSIWGRSEADDTVDAIISGDLTCNGYSEPYFKALFMYHTPYGPLLPTDSQPPQGGTQASLANSIVSRLRGELHREMLRSERARAVGELRGMVEPQHVSPNLETKPAVGFVTINEGKKTD